MPEDSRHKISFQQIRNAIDKEDKLLNDRSMIFLVSNAFLINGIDYDAPTAANIGISMIGLYLSLIWLFTNSKIRNAIRELHTFRREFYPDQEIENKIDKATSFGFYGLTPLYGSTELIALGLPLPLIITWLILAISSLFL